MSGVEIFKMFESDLSDMHFYGICHGQPDLSFAVVPSKLMSSLDIL
jgi:hypothetical protein